MGINRLLIDSRIPCFRQRTTDILKQARTDAGTGRREQDTPPGQGRQPAAAFHLMTVALRSHWCVLIGPVNRRRDSQLLDVVVGHGVLFHGWATL